MCVLRAVLLTAVAALSGLLVGCGGKPAAVEREPTKEDLALIQDNILTKAPEMNHPVNADLGGKITYLGCDFDLKEAGPGDVISVRHYWEVVDPPGPGWKLFSHLGPEWRNLDRTPVAGLYPVDQWKAGEIIQDSQNITVPRRWNHPELILYMGIYKGKERLAVRTGEQDGTDRMIALRIPVRADPNRGQHKSMPIRKAWRAPVIDGRLDDPAWAEAGSTGPLNAMLTAGPASPSGEVKLLWDDDFLYAALIANDAHAVSHRGTAAEMMGDDAWHGFVTADPQGAVYLDFTVNPQGDVVVGIVERDLASGQLRSLESGPAADAARKSHLAVTVDDRFIDAGFTGTWIAEVALPWSAIPSYPSGHVRLVPVLANFVRADRRDGVIRPVQSSWVPTLDNDLYDLTRVGILELADDTGALLSNQTPPLVPARKDLPGEMRQFTPEK